MRDTSTATPSRQVVQSLAFQRPTRGRGGRRDRFGLMIDVALFMLLIAGALVFGGIGSLWWSDDPATDGAFVDLVCLWGFIAVGLLLVARAVFSSAWRRALRRSRLRRNRLTRFSRGLG